MHVLSLEDLETFEMRVNVASSCGKHENKTLDAYIKNGAVRYEVKDCGQLVTSTFSLAIAVDAYNRIG